MGVKIPEHWSDISWEEKAKENPLFAVMTTEDVADAPPENFDEKHLGPFMAKGERVYAKDIEPLLKRLPGPKEKIVVAEYGCGVGRILKPVYEAGYQTFGIDISETMLKHSLVTLQTGPEGQPIRKVIVQADAEPDKEYYVAIVFDRAVGQPVLMASAAGGMDIEKVAHDTPEKIIKVPFSPETGLQPFQARRMAYELGFTGDQVDA